MVTSFAGDIPCVVSNSASDSLAELASEYNEDPEEFKKRVCYVYIIFRYSY